MWGGFLSPKPLDSWGAWYPTTLTGDSTPLFRVLLNWHSRLSLQFTRNSEYKIDHIWKTNNCKKLNFSSVFILEHFRQNFVKIVINTLKTKSTISQKKNHRNRRIVFSFVSAHFATFISIWPLLKGGGRSTYR